MRKGWNIERTILGWLCAGAFVCGSAHAQSDFVRGDVDGNGRLDALVDAARLADHLGGLTTVPCEDAADTDDDGVLSTLDVGTLIDHGFGALNPLAPPFPACGPDPTADTLTCVSYTACGAPPGDPVPDSDYLLTLGTATVTEGETATVPVTFENNGDAIAGWAISVCHDNALVEVAFVEPLPALTALNPDFSITEWAPGLGWRAAALIRYDGSAALGAGIHPLYDAHYDTLTPGEVTLAFCAGTLPEDDTRLAGYGTNAGRIRPATTLGSITVDPLGGPFIRGDVDGNGEVDFIVDTAYLSAALFSAGPAPTCMDAADFDDNGLVDLTDISLLLNAGFVAVAPIPPPYPNCGIDPTDDSLTCEEFTGCAGPPPPPAPDSNFSLGFGSPTPAGDVPVQFGNGGGDLAGWSFGVCHDSAEVEINGVNRGSDLVTLDPDFEVRKLYPGQGWTAAALLSFTGATTLGPGTYELYIANYTLVGSGNSELTVCGGLGSPPVPISFAGTSGTSVGSIVPVTPPTLIGNPTGGPFRRGDANGEGVINLADSIFLINYQFQSGPVPPCLRSADANKDGTVNIADSIWLINYFFLEGPQPPAPFPACGNEFPATGLDCNSYPACG